MRRQRTCSNPVPKGGGDDCLGDDVQRETCTSICPGNLQKQYLHSIGHNQ